MLPGAIFTSALGVLAGGITDQRGVRLPTRVGSPLMLIAIIGLSTYTGASAWVIAIFAGILGGVPGLVNTPLPASALTINSMLFFFGRKFGHGFAHPDHNLA